MILKQERLHLRHKFSFIYLRFIIIIIMIYYSFYFFSTAFLSSPCTVVRNYICFPYMMRVKCLDDRCSCIILFTHNSSHDETKLMFYPASSYYLHCNIQPHECIVVIVGKWFALLCLCLWELNSIACSWAEICVFVHTRVPTCGLKTYSDM